MTECRRYKIERLGLSITENLDTILLDQTRSKTKQSIKCFKITNLYENKKKTKSKILNVNSGYYS